MTKIFCIGFHKTGTTSIGKALEQLGFSVQGSVGTGDPDIAEKVFDLALPLVEDYDAFRDNPWPIIFKELDARWRGSKFILTVRNSESWIRSQTMHFGTRSTPMRQWIYGAGCPVGNEKDYIGRFEAHNREVIAYFEDRPDDLLIVDLEKGDGWEKLCPFLGKVLPDTPFPHVNPASKRAGKKKSAARRGIPILARLRRSIGNTRRARLQAWAAKAQAQKKRISWAAGSNFRLQRISENDAVIEFGSLGSGPLVILHPAKGGSGIDQFDELGAALGGAGFHAVAINPRGVGASSGRLHNLSLHHLAADVAALLQHFGGPAHLVGRALGNRVVRCCATDYPDLVKSVTLIAAGGRFPKKEPHANQKSQPRQSRLYWTKAGLAHKHAAQETPLSDWWDGGQSPMLVIQGLEDYVAVPENGRSLAQDFPERVRLIEIPDAGHQLLFQRPDLIIPEVLSFITEIEKDSAASVNQ